jgi:acetolactate synthase I/II/III large subunit
VPADVDNDYQPAAELRGDIAATLLERIDHAARAHPATDAGLNPAAVVLKIRELLDDDATVACDVGSHYIYMASHFRAYQPRRLLFSDGQQTLGVALPWPWPRRWCGQAPRWCPSAVTADSSSAHYNWRLRPGSA